MNMKSLIIVWCQTLSNEILSTQESVFLPPVENRQTYRSGTYIVYNLASYAL